MSVRQRVPDQLLGPLGVVSLLVGITGIVVGYIFTMLGVTLFFDLNGIQPIKTTDSLIVIGSGIACIAAGYLGFKGFMSFAY